MGGSQLHKFKERSQGIDVNKMLKYIEMEKESLINLVSQSLREIFKEDSSKGILSIYIWGSIITPDFNPESSDIDTIAIVNDEIKSGSEEEIQKQLELKHPEIKKLGFRLVYKSEFDTGITKGTLGSIGNPALLLLDLPTWHWVCGTKFSQKDFALPVPTYDEAIKLRYENTKERWPEITLIKPEQIQYFVKQILRIIHLQQLKRAGLSYTIFSYTSVKKNASGKPEEGLVNICLQIKSSKWNFGEFEKHKDAFKEYISNLST